MTKEEKIEFAELYFSEHTVHDNFQILEKADSCFRSLPEEIDDTVFSNMCSALLKKRGLFANLRFVSHKRFPLLKEVFFALAPLSAAIYHADCLCSESDISYDKAFNQSAERFCPEYVNRHEASLLSYMELVFLFNLHKDFSFASIKEYSETGDSFEAYQLALDALLMEKRYSSSKAFQIVEVNRLTISNIIEERAINTALFFEDKIARYSEKCYYFLCLLLLLVGSKESHAALRRSAFSLKKKNSSLFAMLGKIVKRCSPVFVDDTLFHDLCDN